MQELFSDFGFANKGKVIKNWLSLSLIEGRLLFALLAKGETTGNFTVKDFHYLFSHANQTKSAINRIITNDSLKTYMDFIHLGNGEFRFLIKSIDGFIHLVPMLKDFNLVGFKAFKSQYSINFLLNSNQIASLSTFLIDGESLRLSAGITVGYSRKRDFNKKVVEKINKDLTPIFIKITRLKRPFMNKEYLIEKNR